MEPKPTLPETTRSAARAGRPAPAPGSAAVHAPALQLQPPSPSRAPAAPASLAALAALAAFAALASLAPAPEALAQIAGAKPVTPQDAWNPKPDEADFALPMPCGLSMAFRPIFIPEKGLLGEMEGYFGSELQDSSGNASLGRKRRAFVGSPLSIGDLPELYRAVAAAAKAKLSG
ncbi:MAG: hypothetical protein LBQ12_13880, partial [Deltaproteobacteria bacterium]|nr:hypothetical protein [Deltaproteobacteria bacterium]